MAIVKVDSLSKTYGPKRVLDNVSFKADDGDFAVILGPSGSGKTTLLRCIAGLEEPDNGSVYIDEVSVKDLTPRERDVSMVFQSYSLFPHMSVRENLAFPLVVRHKPRQEVDERVRAVAGMLRIEEQLEKRPSQLSGGEQQRVSLGRAIIREPKAFLMDEPLSGLDAPLKLQMRAELKRIQGETRLTTIYVTHDQVEAMGLANRLGVMRSGELMQYDTPRQVYSHPRNAFVAGFVGNPPASFLDAEVKEENDEVRLVGEGFSWVVSGHISQLLRGGGARVLIGVRPEGVHLGVGRENPNTFVGVVDYTEDLGALVIAHIKIGSKTISASLSPQEVVSPGASVSLSWDVDKVSIFDAQTGELMS